MTANDADNLAVLVGAVVIPLIVGRFVSRFWLAATISAMLLSLLLHISGWIAKGYIEPFFVVSIPVSLVVFLLWSLALVWIAQRAREMKKRDRKVESDSN